MSNFMKIRPVGGELLDADGQNMPKLLELFAILLTRLKKRQDRLNEQSTAEFMSVDCHCCRGVKLLIGPRCVIDKGIHFLLRVFFFAVVS
jgi:hypothetical protein